jgi:hypothetical protein
MRKLAIALVAAITAGAAVPAAAQVGFYAGPGGIGVGVGPGYYGYDPGYYGYGPRYAWPYHRHFYQWRHEPYARSW